MWKLAWRNVFRHRTRTGLTVGAIMFGVASLIVTAGFVEDTLIQLREGTIGSQYGHIQIYKAGFTSSGRAAPFKFMIDDPESTSHRLQGIEHIVDILPRVNISALLSNGKTTLAVVGEGVDAKKETRLSSFLTLVSGKHLTADQRFGMLIGQGVANTLRLKSGDRATILLSTAGGALNSLDLEVVGVFQTFSKDYDDRAVRITIDAAQELTSTRGVHKLVLVLDDTEFTGSVAMQISKSLPSGQFEIKKWQELADFYEKAADLYRRYFVVLRLIILGLVFLGVANSVNLTIYQRIGEFGTLTALGNRSNTIFQLLVSENLILALIGAVSGSLLGVVLAMIVSYIGIPMPPMPNTNTGYTAMIRIIPEEIITAFLIGVFATVAAAILPACRVSRLPTVVALRHN